MPTVLLTEEIDPAGISVLRAAGLEVCEYCETPDAVVRADAILVRTAQLDAALLGKAERLKIVSKHGVGCDNIDLEHLAARNIPVAIAADANATSVAEHTFALMLALTRQLDRQRGAVQNGNWHDRLAIEAMELSGRTLLVVGLGRVGRRVADRAAAFGMEIYAHDPYVDTAPYLPAPDLFDALSQTDVLCLHVPLTPSSRHMIDTGALAALKSGAFIVNCARGGIVDETAMLEALNSGRLQGYGTDVFDTEPAAPDHPLIQHPQTLATPHAAAMSDAGRRAMAVQSAENVVAALKGQLSPAVVFGQASWT